MKYIELFILKYKLYAKIDILGLKELGRKRNRN